jgi:hypothetical protein
VRVRAWALMSAAVQPAVAGIAFTIDGAPVRLARRYPGEWLLDPGPGRVGRGHGGAAACAGCAARRRAGTRPVFDNVAQAWWGA